MESPFAGPPADYRRDCFWHPDADEGSVRGAFTWCDECGHVWQTPDEFYVSIERMGREIAAFTGKEFAAPINPQTLAYCPLCAHDF